MNKNLVDDMTEETEEVDNTDGVLAELAEASKEFTPTSESKGRYNDKLNFLSEIHEEIRKKNKNLVDEEESIA